MKTPTEMILSGSFSFDRVEGSHVEPLYMCFESNC